MIEAAKWLKVERFADADAIKAAYLDTLDGKMSAEEAVIFDVNEGNLNSKKFEYVHALF